MYNMVLVDFDKLNAPIEPAKRPIIKLPQYSDIYGAISDSLNEPNSGVFNNEPMLLCIVTSVPT